MDPFRAPTTIGRYKVIDRLGRGAMGVVFSARDERLGRDVAIKIMNSGVDDEPVRRVLDPRPVRVDRERAWAALQRDKKARNGEVRLVLLDAPGRPRWGAEVPEADVRAALDALIAG